MAGAARHRHIIHDTCSAPSLPSGCCLFPRFFIFIRTAPLLCCSTKLHWTGDYLNQADFSNGHLWIIKGLKFICFCKLSWDKLTWQHAAPQGIISSDKMSLLLCIRRKRVCGEAGGMHTSDHVILQMLKITKNSTNNSTYSTDCVLVHLRFRHDGSMFRSAVRVISVLFFLALFHVQSLYVVTGF